MHCQSRSAISRLPLPPFLAVSSLFLLGLNFLQGADGPGVPNVAYDESRVGEILSIIDPGKAVSAATLHRGYLFVPLSADHGGGQGAGAFAFYDVSDPQNPVSVFDSRNDAFTYHNNPASLQYVGNWAELHHLSVSGDLMLISEKRNGSAGFSIFDVAPLYDDDPATKPRTVSRFSFAGVTSPTNYDGFSFAPAWQGRRYVYAPTGAQGLYIIDTTDPANPVQLRHLSRSAIGNVTMRGAWVIGNLLILAESDVMTNFRATTYDVSDPGNPTQLATFTGPFGYHGFVYGSAFYGGGSPIVRHDFSDPSNIVETQLYADPGFQIPEYGYGHDGHLFIGHYPGSTKWKINGDTVEPMGRVNSGLFDDHAFLNPLGNLVMLCSDHNNDRKIMIGIHGKEQDALPPQPLFVSPANGATGRNVLSRVGISFSDFVDPVSVNGATMVVRNLSTGEVVPGSYSAMMGIVNFAPDAPLDPDTTYDVTLSANGIRDQAGNSVGGDVMVTRFSTGSSINGYTVALASTTPVETGSPVNLSVNVTNDSSLSLEHSWDFGDGSAATPFSPATSATHTYAAPGNFTLRVRTRIAGQTYAPSITGVQVIHAPISPQAPSNHSTIVADPARTMVWTINPDNDSVSGIDTTAMTRVYEIPVGGKPGGLAIGPGDTLWVTNRESATLSVIDRANGSVVATHTLHPGSSPHGIVIDLPSATAYVTLEGIGKLAKISTASGEVTGLIDAGPWPRGLALDPVRRKLWVSRFISPDEGGEVSVVDLDGFGVEAVLALPPVMTPDGLQNGRGIPNYLAAPVLSPDLKQGFIPSKKDNIFRGLQRDGLPLTFEHSVRSMASRIDLEGPAIDAAAALDFDNSDFATSAVFSPLGNVIFFATSGSSTIWVADAYDPTSTYTFDSGGRAPDGMALSADGTRLYIHNFMDRSVTVFRTSAACGAVCGTTPQIAKIGTVSAEQLEPAVLRGKQLFYDSKDPRLAQEGYMSCASCHLDGGHDGRVWDFTSLGEGMRNTIDLNGRGVGHGPAHWTGNFDETQDFEGQIRDFARGMGFIPNDRFHQGSIAQPLGESKAGVSSDLDDLAAYIASLTSTGISPHREAGGALNEAAQAGREIFRQENCASCHGGSTFTDSASMVRHDVGTATDATGSRLGEPLDGFDTPTLRGLWKTAPYLHDGSAVTLKEVLVERDISGRHGHLFHRSSVEIEQLVAYLNSIDDLETSAPGGIPGDAPQIADLPDREDPVHRTLSFALGASGTSPFTWHALALPPGLHVDADTGIVHGAPSQPGRFVARIGARDAAGRTHETSFTWIIADPPFAYRYVKLVALSSHGGASMSTVAEFNLIDAGGVPMARNGWTATANTQETASENAPASNVLDGNNGTFWHSKWGGGHDPHPHELVVDLGAQRVFSGFTMLPRQGGSSDTRIRDYRLFVSKDGMDWGAPRVESVFANNNSLQTVYFAPVFDPDVAPLVHRYVKLEALSSHGGPSMSTVAEFNLIGADGAPLARSGWTATANTQETVGENAPASNVLDGNNSTFWHSKWFGRTDPHPHELVIDLGTQREFFGFTLLPRQNGNSNTLIRDYRFSVSDDGANWGTPLIESIFEETISLRTVYLHPLLDVNHPPVFAPVQPALSVVENSPVSTLVGTVSASDPDQGQSVTYSLGGGNTGGVFQIDPVSGQIRVASPPDYETQPIHHLQVIATDNHPTGAYSTSLIVPVTVINVIENNHEAVHLALTGAGKVYAGHGNPALVDFLADPDGDGVPNAIEVLFGTDPSTAGAPPPIGISHVETGDGIYMEFEFKVAAGSGVTLRCFGSDDLDRWDELANAPVLIGTENGVSIWRVRDDRPLSETTSRFMRIGVDEESP